MELNKVELLLEKYFEGETNIVEENELQNYFSSPNVAQHLEQYKNLFGYFSQAKTLEFKHEIPLQSKRINLTWLSVAASIVVLLGVGTYIYFNDNAVKQDDLGTYEDPEVAFRATQKALSLLSQNVNVGVQSVHYINEFEDSKSLIFKKINNN